jgi:hypothetical protein
MQEEGMNAVTEVMDELRRVLNERDDARAQRDAAIARITEVGVMVATNGNELAKDAYRRGAEAMREALLKVLQVERASWNPEGHTAALLFRLSGTISALPIPEEP